MTRAAPPPRRAAWAAAALLALAGCGGGGGSPGGGADDARSVRPAPAPAPAAPVSPPDSPPSPPAAAPAADSAARPARATREAPPPAAPFATLGAAEFQRRIAGFLPSWGSRDPADYGGGDKVRAQPALAAIGAPHAWARGLSGRGVTIAVQDEGVDIGAAEFAGRVSPASRLVRPRPFAHDPADRAFAACDREQAPCRVFETDAGGDRARVEDAARRVAAAHGWPTARGTWFIRDTSRADGGGWFEIPALWEVDASGAPSRGHGTQVASAALGWRFGVAPGAELAALAIDFGGRREGGAVGAALDGMVRGAPALPPDLDAAALDAEWARERKALYAGFDIVNRSFGVAAWSDRTLDAQHDDHRVFEAWLRLHLPRSWAALTQTDAPEAGKTLETFAAGNASQRRPEANAARAGRIPALRGLSFAVTALGADGAIAPFANWCGPLPPDWDAARDGRHFCLAAPGTAIRAANPDPDPATAEENDSAALSGASFAAPLAAGALALMTEAFRGQLSPREIGRRLVDTANDSGRYALSEIYGAGALDLAAATRPAGALETGTESLRSPLARARFAAPAAWGDLGARLAGVEMASFDAWGAPFWSDAGALFAAAAPRYAGPALAAAGGFERWALPPRLGWADAPAGAPGPWAALAPRAIAGAARGPGAAPRQDAFGLSVRAAPFALRAGFLAESRTALGAAPSGAFGAAARSRLVWLSREHRWPVSPRAGLSLEFDWLAAAGEADWPPGAMFEAGPAAYSAAALTLARDAGRSRLRLSLSQPLRAEAGRGVFTRPVGRTREGTRLYARRDVTLRPDAREARLTLRGERPLAGGALVWEVGHARDAGHVRGRRATFAGAAWRLRR